MSRLVILIACMSVALAAPQFKQDIYTVASGAGPTYTVSNRPRGFSIETGGAVNRGGGVANRGGSSGFSSQSAYSSSSSSSAAQEAAAQAAAAQFAAQQAAAQQAAAQQAAAQQAAAQQAAAQQAAAQQAAAQEAARRAAADQAAAAAARAAASQRASAAQSAQFSSQQSSSFGAGHGGASYSAGSGSSYHGSNALQNAFIIRQNQDVADDGSSFTYGFESDNGIQVQSQGTLKVLGPDAAGHAITGSYSYIGDDGQTYTVNYTADENGFQATGAHLPPISEEIARSIEYNLAHPEEWNLP